MSKAYEIINNKVLAFKLGEKPPVWFLEHDDLIDYCADPDFYVRAKINTLDGWKFAHKGNYIVLDCDQRLRIYHKEEFNKKYKAIDVS